LGAHQLEGSGFSFIFIILGIAASFIGNILIFFGKELRIAAGIIIIIFSLNLLGILNLNLPARALGMADSADDQSAEDLTVRSVPSSRSIQRYAFTPVLTVPSRSQHSVLSLHPCSLTHTLSLSHSLSSTPHAFPSLQAFVQELLQQMQSRFSQMSETIISRIDEMGGRIDELESSISDLMDQAGVEAAEDDAVAANPPAAP
jgi:heat shock factor-binding protein 1